VLSPGDPQLLDLAVPGARYTANDLRWWMRDRYGFLLADVRALPFTPWRGNLNFWPVPATAVASMGLPPTPEEWAP
jgi:hypothetical protein